MKIVTTNNASATQTEHPARAAMRTFIQAWIPGIIGALVVVPEIVRIVLDEFTRSNVEPPEQLRLILVAIATGAAIVSAVIARVMAIPAVERALRTLGLGAAPTDPDFGNWDGLDSEDVEPVGDGADDPDDATAVDGDAAPDGDADGEGYTVTSAFRPESAGDADPEDDPGTEVDATPPPDGYEPRH